MILNFWASLSLGDYFLVFYILFLGWYLITRYFQWKDETFDWYCLSTAFITISAVIIDILFIYDLFKSFSFLTLILLFLVAFFSTWDAITCWLSTIYMYEEALEEEIVKLEAEKEKREKAKDLNNPAVAGLSYLADTDGNLLKYELLDIIPSDEKEFLILKIKDFEPENNLCLLCRVKEKDEYVFIETDAEKENEIFNLYYNNKELACTDQIETDNKK